MLQINLDNLEELQESWIAQYDGANAPAPPPPSLNSPRSLEACNRASIDPFADLRKVTLRQMLYEVLAESGNSSEGDGLLPVKASLENNRQYILSLFPVPLQPLGSDAQKLEAYDRYQQAESRRSSTVRMLREIRDQLIAAEQFRSRREEAVKKQLQQQQQQPSTQQQQALLPPKSSTHRHKDGSQSPLPRPAERSSSRASEADTAVSASTISVFTKQRGVTDPSQSRAPAAPGADATAAGSPVESDSGPTTSAAAAAGTNGKPPLMNSVEALRIRLQAAATAARKASASVSHQLTRGSTPASRSSSGEQVAADSDDDYDDTHYAQTTGAMLVEDDYCGVELIHIVSRGPHDAAMEAMHRLKVRETLAEAQKRQERLKEEQRLAAIAREQLEQKLEMEERVLVRESILKGRNFHRTIQTPKPLESASSYSSYDPMHSPSPPLLSAPLSARSEAVGDAPQQSATNIPPPPPPPPFSNAGSVRPADGNSQRSSPRGIAPTTPPMPLDVSFNQREAADALLNSFAPDASVRSHHSHDSSPPLRYAAPSVTVSSVTASRGPSQSATRAETAKQRREALGAALAYRSGSADTSQASSSFDYSNALERAKAVDRRPIMAPEQDDSPFKERWEAIERAKKRQLLLEGYTLPSAVVAQSSERTLFL